VPGNRVIDTLSLARRTGRFGSHSLRASAGSSHRLHLPPAEADAWAAGKLLLHLVAERNR